MPCDSTRRPEQTEEQRRAEIDRALTSLVEQLGAGTARAVIGPNGAIAFSGWQDSARVTDACAYRTLAGRNSWEFRQAIARAEAVAGRKVSIVQIAGGVHSHDGGKTWHGGH